MSSIDELGAEQPTDARLAEIRRRGRAGRRTHRALGASVLAAVALVVALVAANGPPATRRVRTLGPGTPSAGPPPPVPPPAVAVVHLPSATGKPGQIAVVDVPSGAVLRVLGSEYDPYPQNGFVLSADRQTLYYDHLDQAAQKVEIMAVPVAGGPSRVVAEGTQPAPSDDGTLLAFTTPAPGVIEILHVPGGVSATYSLPSSQGQIVRSFAWERATHTLLAIATSPLSIECFSVIPCPSPSVPRFPPSLWRLNLDRPAPAWEQVHPGYPFTDYARVIAPGRVPGTVVATDGGPILQATGVTPTSTPAVVLTLSDSGNSIDRIPLSGHILSVDRSGSDFLVGLPDSQTPYAYPGGSRLGWVSLAFPTPVPVGGVIAAQASW